MAKAGSVFLEHFLYVGQNENPERLPRVAPSHLTVWSASLGRSCTGYIRANLEQCVPWQLVVDGLLISDPLRAEQK